MTMMGQAVLPISVTCSKWYIRRPPLILGLSLCMRIHWVTSILLNKLVSQKLWCPSSLSEPSCNISGGSSGIWRVVFSPSVAGSVSLACRRDAPARCHQTCCSKGREPLSWWGTFELSQFGPCLLSRTHHPADVPERDPEPIYYDQQSQIQGGRQTFVYQPFTTTDLLNQKHHIPLSLKSLRLWLI
jgi:hypothetical protein